jgi:hypothetical protein
VSDDEPDLVPVPEPKSPVSDSSNWTAKDVVDGAADGASLAGVVGLIAGVAGSVWMWLRHRGRSGRD